MSLDKPEAFSYQSGYPPCWTALEFQVKATALLVFHRARASALKGLARNHVAVNVEL